MNKSNFPFIAIGLGLFFWFVILVGGKVDAEGVTKLPLLTLLVISEFAFFVTLIGAYMSIRECLAKGVDLTKVVVTICCALLALRFLLSGIDFWPL